MSSNNQNNQEQPGLPDPRRRRLATGGLAGTVVLGSLISKPVLAGPHLCMMSMAGSINTSHNTAPPCSSLGQTVSYWKTNISWPSGVTKGTLPITGSGPVTFPSPGKGTEFDVYMGVNAFRFDNNSGVVSFDTSNATSLRASMYQVLATSGADDLELGREIVAAILNSIQFATYPLTTAKVKQVYADLISVGTTLANNSTPWDKVTVLAYLKTLHT